MSDRRFSLLLCAAALLAVPAGAARAQAGFFVAGGPSIPLGDYGDFAQTGWMAFGGVHLGLPLVPVKFRAEGMYGQNAHEGPSTEKTALYGGMANVIFQVGPPLVPVKPYIIGGAGYLNHHYSPGDAGGASTDEWKVVWGGGVGVSVSLLVVGAFVEARYLKRNDTSFLPITVGLRFGG